ncbi:unnamed protein product [Darwinula stevensoni]|uniref:Uncharacterized protein n=1 Tax=Darwinula stevensoni TaxID=69355 RepID=A0A7R9AAC9_9CRUS|nr:unnamed protein product [Darwinula stevensoni]CAG0898146.1 unnamed protein product [Darwinula stevensoni]
MEWITSIERRFQKLEEMTLVVSSSACRHGLAPHHHGRQNFHTSHGRTTDFMPIVSLDSLHRLPT